MELDIVAIASVVTDVVFLYNMFVDRCGSGT